MAKLGNLTKKVAGAVVSGTKSVGKAAAGKIMSVGRGTAKVATGVVGGITKGISRGASSVAKGAARSASQTFGLDALRPTNILSSSLDSVGLGILGPAFGGSDKRSAAAASRVASDNLSAKSPNISTATMESLLRGLVAINQKILDNTNELIKYSKEQKSALSEANELTKQKMLTDLENMRESKGPKAANDNKAGGNKDEKAGKGLFSTVLGGIIGTIGSVIGGLVKTFTTILGLLAPIVGFASSLLGLFSSIVSMIGGISTAAINLVTKLLPMIGSFLSWIGRFFITMGEFLIANPIVAAIVLAIAALASLKAADWSKFFDNFTKIFSDLAEGKFLDAIIRTMMALPGLIITALGRLLAIILDFFGFKNAAKAIDDFLDNFDLPQLVIDFVDKAFTYIGEFLSNAGKVMGEFFGSIKDWVVAKFTDATKAFSDWWADFHPLDAILDFFGKIKDWVVTKFTEAVDAFSKWWADFHPLDAILDFFGKIKDWVVIKFTEAVDAFSQWWDSFSILDIVLTPFRYLKEKAISIFDDLKKEISDILAFDLVGKIGGAISSLINSVWGFFKALPGKAMDLIGGFIPDSLKNLWSSVFGTGAPTAQNNNSTAPAMTAQNNNVTPASLSGRDQVFNQQSARMASNQSAPVVIMNNNTNVSGGGGAPTPNPIPRSSGAVSTAPQASHIDRALYGNAYGTGVP